MKEYREQPDIIKFTTPIINVGYLNQGKILEDPLINIDKQSNQDIISNGCWLTIENELYYFKVPITNLTFLKELLGEKVTRYFSLPSVHYNLSEATYHENRTLYHVYGLLSKWARKLECNYTTLENSLMNGYLLTKSSTPLVFNDLDLLDTLDGIFPKQPILKEIRYFLVREFISQQPDRQASEILIEEDQDQVRLGYLLDYENEWIDYPDKRYHLPYYFNLNPEDKEVLNKIRTDEFMQEALIEAMDIDILKLLKEIEEEHKIRLVDYDKSYFTIQEKKMKEYIKEKKMIK